MNKYRAELSRDEAIMVCKLGIPIHLVLSGKDLTDYEIERYVQKIVYSEDSLNMWFTSYPKARAWV